MITLENKVKVSDPCYEYDTWCSTVLENVEPGNYHTFVKYENGDWGVRVAELLAIHKRCSYDSTSYQWKLENENIGVDSGQCGIFNANYYKIQKKLDDIFKERNGTEIDSDKWFYGRCCMGTKDPYNWAEIDGEGVVAASGYGDGVYELYTITENDKIVGFKLVFID